MDDSVSADDRVSTDYGVSTDDRVSWRQSLLPLINIAPAVLSLAAGDVLAYVRAQAMGFAPYTADPVDTYFVPAGIAVVLVLPMFLRQRRLFVIACVALGALEVLVCTVLVLTIPFIPIGLGLMIAGFARRRIPLAIGIFALMFVYDAWLWVSLVFGRLS